MTPKLSQNQKSELKKTYKIKVVQLHEYALKQFSDPTPIQKLAQKVKNDPKIKSKSKVEIEENLKM